MRYKILHTRTAALGASATEAEAPSAAHLVAADLVLGYAEAPGLPPVIEGVSLELKPGERVSLVGTSGSGKTTLLHALAGLLRPLGGRVTVDGVEIASPDGQCTSAHAAYMFQRDLLMPWKTTLENAAFAAMVARPKRPGSRDADVKAEAFLRARRLLSEFGLDDALNAYPHQLSGGMRQRVALARTLILNRNLVVLDEPFANLDSLTREDLQSWLRGVMDTHPATWVLVTHDLSEAILLSDRVAVLGGRPSRIVGWVSTTRGTSPRGTATVNELRRLLTVA